MLTATLAAADTYRRDLDNGLLLRWSTENDTENIAQLAGLVFRATEDKPPNKFLQEQIHRLMRGDHPLMGPGDFAVVEDTRKEGNPLVACICLLRQDWSYEGIPFRIGRPEIVASDPTYRNKGLIRALFEMIHARSMVEKHMVQAITGIPYFYRQFGYEYVLDLGGKRITYCPLIPQLKQGETESYTLREATVEDIPLLMTCYNRRKTTSIVWTDIRERYWLYVLEGWKKGVPEQDHTDSIQIIVDATGIARGYISTTVKRWSKSLEIWAVDTAPGVSVQTMMPSLLRALQTYGLHMPTYKPDTESLSEISFALGRVHPVYDSLGNTLAPFQELPYAWYVRVPDVASFIRHITPALEKRLANTDLVGYTGELKLDFYQRGLRMVFESGRLITIERWRFVAFDSSAGAGFPSLIFLQLIFGYRSLDELRHIFPDVWANNETEVVLKALFPARPSFVAAII